MVSATAHPSRVHRYLRAGPLLMALGAVLVLAGIVQTTSSTSNGGNQACPSGTVLIAKFNYEHSYVFEKPAGNEHVVTLSNASSTGATWHSTLPVSAVIVKGGPASVVTTLTPPQYSGTFSNAGLPEVGNVATLVGHHKNLPAISNVQFCGPHNPPTTTTTVPPSSTTTTTTVPPSSTTTTESSSSTTTTKSSSSTTTTSPPETTTTTTTPPTSTTTTESTTTTTSPLETTTTGSETTTTHPSGSTTTASRPPTTQRELGSTTIVSVVTSTTVITPGSHNLPFTGGNSMTIVILGIVLLAAGLTLTLSDVRRRQRNRV